MSHATIMFEGWSMYVPEFDAYEYDYDSKMRNLPIEEVD